MAKFAVFLLWLHRSQGFRLSSIRSSRLMLSYRFTLSFGPSSAPFGCLPLAGLFALLLGPLLCFFASYLPRRSLVKMVLFFVALASAIPIGELQALSLCFSFVRGDSCLSFVFTFVAKCESLLVPSLAPSWLYLCPTLQLVSTYVLCFAQFVPSAFSWTGRLPCSVAPAVFLSLRAARLGLFLWPRFRSSSGWCSCSRCCQACG